MKNHKISAIINYLSIVLSNVSNIILTVFLIRIYNINEYAIYTLITTIISIFIMFDLGLNNSIIKFLSPHKTTSLEYKKYNTYLLLFFIILILILEFSMFIFWGYSDSYLSSHFDISYKLLFYKMLNWAIAIILLNVIIKYLTGLISSRDEFKSIKLIDLIRVTIRLILVIAILLSRLSIIYFILMDFLLSLIVFFCLMLICLKRRLLSFMKIKLKAEYIYPIFYHAFFIFLLSIMDIIFWKFGQIIMGNKLSSFNISVYSICMLLIQLILSFNGVINSLLYPSISKHSKNDDFLRELYYKNSYYQSGILLLLICSITVIGYSFLNLILNKNFNDSIILFLIISGPLYILCSQSTLTFILFAKGLHRIRTLILFISAISLYFFTSIYIYNGVYVVTIILSIHLSIFHLLILNIYYKKVLSISVKKTFESIVLKHKLQIIFTIIIITLVIKYNNIYINLFFWIIYLMIYGYKTIKYLKVSI